MPKFSNTRTEKTKEKVDPVLGDGSRRDALKAEHEKKQSIVLEQRKKYLEFIRKQSAIIYANKLRENEFREEKEYLREEKLEKICMKNLHIAKEYFSDAQIKYRSSKMIEQATLRAYHQALSTKNVLETLCAEHPTEENAALHDAIASCESLNKAKIIASGNVFAAHYDLKKALTELNAAKERLRYGMRAYTLASYYKM